jgi:hypothetical protein
VFLNKFYRTRRKIIIPIIPESYNFLFREICFYEAVSWGVWRAEFPNELPSRCSSARSVTFSEPVLTSRRGDTAFGLTASLLIYATIKTTIFWDITPFSPLKVNRRFGGTNRLHLQGRRINRARNQRESRWQAEQILLICVIFFWIRFPCLVKVTDLWNTLWYKHMGCLSR